MARAGCEEQETRRRAKVSRRSRRERGEEVCGREQQETDWSPMILSWGYEDPAVMVREMLVISGDPGRAETGDQIMSPVLRGFKSAVQIWLWT